MSLPKQTPPPCVRKGKKSDLLSLNHLFTVLTIGFLILLIVISHQLFRTLTLKWFVVIESLMAICLLLFLLLYRRTIVPMRKIGGGMDLLSAQDFNSRLSYVGQSDADRIVDLFNALMGQLKNERLRIREQNQFLDLLVNASPLGIVILSLNGEIESLNPSCRKFLQLPIDDSLIGNDFKRINHPLIVRLAHIVRGESEIVRLGNAHIYKCTHASFIDRGFYRSFFLIEQLTREWFESERQAYEKVIRTISHEVNNTLAGVTCTLDSLLCVEQEQNEESEVVELLQTTTDRCFRLSRFISNYADVVKLPEPKLSTVSLNEMIARSIPFWESVCRSGKGQVKLEVKLSPVSATIDSDWILMEQVLLNIIKNAVEAIETKGKVVVTTNNNPAEIVIANNGQPISKEASEKLFTPFFSTKQSGQGIGLIVIREILQRHGFAFSLASHPDGWTKFSIWL